MCQWPALIEEGRTKEWFVAGWLLLLVYWLGEDKRTSAWEILATTGDGSRIMSLSVLYCVYPISLVGRRQAHSWGVCLLSDRSDGEGKVAQEGDSGVIWWIHTY